MSNVPTGSRANIPGYGITSEPYDVSWDDIAAKIEGSRNYWISTSRRDGRAHAMPVWGVWVDGWLYFSTGPTTVKGRNLRRDPRVSVHLESGDDVVILEGSVERVTGRTELTRFADAYDLKYGFRPDPDDPDGLTYRVEPRVAHTWLEKDFPNTAMRWVFP
jgi:PPOX class probable F420-dependent enzyme